MDKEYCEWVIRPGINDTFWAYTPCKSGFNYLSKVNNANEIEDVYNNYLCPICGNKIKCNIELIRGE